MLQAEFLAPARRAANNKARELGSCRNLITMRLLLRVLGVACLLIAMVAVVNDAIKNLAAAASGYSRPWATSGRS